MYTPRQLLSPAQVSRAILHALTSPQIPSGSCVRVTVQQGKSSDDGSPNHSTDTFSRRHRHCRSQSTRHLQTLEATFPMVCLACDDLWRCSSLTMHWQIDAVSGSGVFPYRAED
jgi:hypothetical protein